ncbi:peptidoglycan DD-metalloendopeptidase family protein [Marnyiella aurantia]|uniref:Peptidoglycan DD-metalloendopeptidase family protein n=1 Tax=Marnyiella aurantia TaxID=2758037 RepID=A0A7D7LS20_9FLAO|nr:peptidoglycan DD-metalloendopeptidase family protein [Marnyiella aurantia]MBA5246092.1 peptidoglycan DD-metalloendopeptidase family protein [Marnyiella aurantia]QMS98518.1 peptidoglycan DD-metalloendopeptidase family protein [Marnyiella aurantia]
MTTVKDILQKQTAVKVIDASIDYKDYVAFDLSAQHTDELKLDLTDAGKFEEFVENHLSANRAKVAFGGYLEKRNLYKRSSNFNDENSEERNIHIGLDLWIKAGTAVLSALDGKIHSLQNNTFLGDYGPTVIVEHEIEGITFYTLYGHLSLESLNGKKVGQLVKKGEKIAELGKPPVNGDYAPHLHFQIIKNIENKKGDYPGVCSICELDYYSENCPDPNLLLKIGT